MDKFKAAGVQWDAEARRERLIANGYKTDSRCTWLAIGRCSQCGRVHDGGVQGTVKCQACDGKGIAREAQGSAWPFPCPTCNGTGAHGVKVREGQQQ